MKFTIVDKETCIGCYACMEVAPELFGQDARGNSHVLIDENQGTMAVQEELYDDLYDAYEGCPSGSIKIADQTFDGNPNRYE